MRIALVDPFVLQPHSPPSWCLGVLEAGLLDHHDLEICDFGSAASRCPSLAEFRRLEQGFIERVSEAAARCDVLYVTTSFGVPQKVTPILGRVQRIVEQVARAAPCRIAVGGAQVHYLTVHGADPFRVLPDLPVAAFAASDLTFLRMVAAWEEGRPLSRLPGLWLRMPDGEGRFTGEAQLAPPVAVPVWRGWARADYPRYRATLTSVGCRHHCSFCFEQTQPFSTFALQRVLASHLEGRPGGLALEDSSLIGAHGWDGALRGLARAAVGRAAGAQRYSAYLGVDEVYGAEREQVERLRDLGVRTAILGVETSDSETLLRYRKRVRERRVRAALDKLHDAGISTQGCLMLGIPGVSCETTLASFDYAESLPLDVRRWHVFQPSFERLPAELEVREELSLERFLCSDVNVPDPVIPELFDSLPLETFLEEHFLIRAIPYVARVPKRLEAIEYGGEYSLHRLYSEVLARLAGTKESFNEEDCYCLIGDDAIAQMAVFDRDSPLWATAF